MGFISRRFGISQESLRVWNNIDPSSNVKYGDTIYVSKPDLKPSTFVQQNVPLKKGEKYIVQAGDTYAKIAKRYKVPVFLLLQANKGFTKRLTVGDSLSIPTYVRPPRKMSGVNDEVNSTDPAKVIEEPEVNSKSAKSSKKSAKNTTIIYTVVSGDNLYSIAKKFSTNISTIREMNNMSANSNLLVGQKLKIPGTASSSSSPKMEEITHVVKRGEGLWDISRQYGVSIEDIVKWNGLKDTKIKIGEKLKIRTLKKKRK